MSKIEDCKREVSAIYKILMTAIINYDYCLYLHEPQTAAEKKYLGKNRHFRWIRHVIYRMTIIDLAKLVLDSPKTHKYNLFKFLRKLYSDGEYSTLKAIQAKVGEWESTLYSNENVITKIKNLRDKMYSHTDTQIPTIEELEVGLIELEELLEDLKQIVFEIGENVLGLTHSFQNTNFERSSFRMIKILSSFKPKV